MKRLLLTASLVLSTAAWADVPPGPNCGCHFSSGVPLALLGVFALWSARRK